MNVGWKCPVCGRGNAPWLSSCQCGDIKDGTAVKWPDPQPWAPPFDKPIKWPPGSGDPLPEPPFKVTCESDSVTGAGR